MTNSGNTSPQPDHPDITDSSARPEALTSLRAPAIVVQSLLGCWLVCGVVAIVFGFMQRSLLHRVAHNPAQVTLGEVVPDEHRIDAINGVFLGLLIATDFAFLVWFWLAYRNLDALDLRRRYGTGWAIGGWFVPFLNLARPKQVAAVLALFVVRSVTRAQTPPGGASSSVDR